HRYLDATSVTPLAQAHVGNEVTCIGRVASTGVLPTRKGLRVFRAVLRDDGGGAGGVLECAWPGQPFLERQIKKGQLLLVTGPVRYYHGRQLVPREFVILADEGDAGPERGLVLPVYPATEGLTHRQIRGLIHQHLDALLALVHDPHPHQRHAIREIADDMTAPLRMHRMLMGDVGTGKTVVALFAMLLAVENEYQAVIMAPTELLAEQHLATLTRLLAPLELKPDLLIGR